MEDNNLKYVNLEDAKRIYKQYIETNDESLKGKLFNDFHDLIMTEYWGRLCDTLANVKDVKFGDSMVFKVSKNKLL